MKTLKVAFCLTDPLGTDADGEPLAYDAPETDRRDARIRAHLHALETQPKYREWILSNLSKRQRRQHERAAKKFAELLPRLIKKRSTSSHELA